MEESENTECPQDPNDRDADEHWITKGKRALATYTVAQEAGLDLAVQAPHWRDDIYANRGGALLGFSAIMLAAALVYLSASPDAFLSAKRGSTGCADISFVSLVLFFVSSIFSLLSIVLRFNSRGLKEGPVQDVRQLWIRLGKIEASHEKRRRLQQASSVVAGVGTLMLLYSLVAASYMGGCFI